MESIFLPTYYSMTRHHQINHSDLYSQIYIRRWLRRLFFAFFLPPSASVAAKHLLEVNDASRCRRSVIVTDEDKAGFSSSFSPLFYAVDGAAEGCWVKGEEEPSKCLWNLPWRRPSLSLFLSLTPPLSPLPSLSVFLSFSLCVSLPPPLSPFLLFLMNKLLTCQNKLV